MSTVKYRRVPAAAALLLAGAAAVVCAAVPMGPRAHRRDAAGTQGVSLARIEQRLAAGDTDPELWYAYALRLQECGRYRHSAEACRRVLKAEPYHRDAQYRLALALALAKDGPGLLAFLSDLVLADAKLAVALLQRPELAAFASQSDFRRLYRQARSQAMD